MSNTREITKKRIEKEKETLSGLDSSIYKVNFSDDNFTINVDVRKGGEQYSFSILLTDKYPFQEPTVKLNLLSNQFTLINTNDPKPLETFFKKQWTPNITWKLIILNVHRYMASHIKTQKDTEESTIFAVLDDLCKRKLSKVALFIVILISVIYRVLCSFGGYSGVNDPPIFGDYEAQRHWMELTVNLHPSEWYVETPSNDLTYWRLDYPPVSGYISYICGWISAILDPKSMELFHSRGYETPFHKLFMRSTVLVCDLLMLMSAIIVIAIKTNKKYNYQTRLLFLVLVLFTPLLILIDHGHFQYNCAMLGFTLWGVYLCGAGHILLGSICFTLALGVKQMALYYAIPFFCFIVGHLYRSAQLHTKGGSMSSLFKWTQFFLQVMQVGAVVIGTLALIWLPWLTSLESFLNVIKAIFPVKRGLYQLKVASFWCASDIFLKWQNLFLAEVLVVLSMALTLAAAIPSAVILVQMPRLKYFKIALFNCSMAFFFFSYHVHEKTILVPLTIFILNWRFFKHFYLDYIFVATFTNYHMLVEDKLTMQYLVILLTYAYFAYPIMNKLKEGWSKPEKPEIQRSVLTTLRITIEKIYTALISKLVIVAMVILTILDKTVTPPEKYPYLFHLFFALLGFGEFLIVFIYSNLKMVESFKKDKAKEMEASNFSTKETMGKNE